MPLLLPRPIARVARARLLLFLGCAAGASLTGPASAAVRAVPGSFATIGAALLAAAPGDTVRVAAGTYSAATNGEVFPLVLDTGGVLLLGAGVGQSILDAGGVASVLRLDALGGGRVSGFTIQGGRADWGGGIELRAGDFQIDHNLLLGNAALRRGSGVNVGGGSNPWIHHNVIWGNHDADLADAGDPHGVQIGQASRGLVEHNLIGRGDSNGMIYNEGSAPVIRHNIFFQNGTPNVRGRGICALGDNAHAVVAHNLFWGNAISALIVTALGNVSGSVANAADPNDGIYGNLDADPLLVDPDGGGYTLQPQSPAIDAGDPQLPHDPDGTVADLGPFALDQALVAAPPAARWAVLVGLTAAPNPFNPTTEVQVEISRAVELSVEILDARGKRVRLLARGPVPAGVHRVKWDGRDGDGRFVASGVYLLCAQGGGEARTARLTLVR